METYVNENKADKDFLCYFRTPTPSKFNSLRIIQQPAY